MKTVVTYLQLLQPVLTFGLLVLARRGFCAASPLLLPLVDAGVGGDPDDARLSDDMRPAPLSSNPVVS